MLSPNHFSLLCALLLSLPLAIIFTKTTPFSPSSSTLLFPPTINFTNSNKTNQIPNPPSFHNPTNSTPNSTNLMLTLSPPPPPPPPPFLDPIEYDNDDDNLLFQLASKGTTNNPNSKTPKKKKLAFMFLTTTPLPFSPLWEAFFNNTNKNLYNIYIHADPSFNYTPPFSGVFRRRVIPSKFTRRYTPTLIAAARRLMANALIHDRSNYMFALISQSCIPLHSFKFTYRILSRSKKSFIEILDNEPGAWERWAARGEDAMLPEVKFEDFRIGSQFFVLKRKHARVVVRDRRLWNKFKKACLSVDACYPEEHYFPTLLNMVDSRGCVPATLTHVDWNDSQDGHPRTYSAGEVGPELIRSLRSHRPRYGDEINGSESSVSKRRDPFLFARKFGPECVHKLMSLANDVLLKD